MTVREMENEDLINREVGFHHAAWAKGRAIPNHIYVERYNGKFGKGYREHHYDPDNREWHKVVYVTDEGSCYPDSLRDSDVYQDILLRGIYG